MPDRAPPATTYTWSRLVRHTMAYDLVGTVPVIAIWCAMLGTEVVGVLVTLSLLRLALKLLMLPREFTSLRLWMERGVSLDDAELLAAEVSLERAPRRHALSHITGWTALFGVFVVLHRLGIPAAPDAGPAEYGVAGLLLLALLASTGMVVVGVLRPLLLDARADIGAELSVRELAAQRSATSFVSSTMMLNLPYTLAVYFGVCALAGAMLLDAWYARDLAQVQLELGDAAEHWAQTGELSANAERVTLEQLPTKLATLAVERGTKPAPVPLSAVDPAHSLAMAATPVVGGWLLVQTRTNTELPWLFGAIFLLTPLFLLPLARANHAMADAVAGQLRELSVATRQVLEEGSLAGITRFRPADNDEAGRLLTDFNGMLDVLSELASAAQRVADGDLSVNFERSGELHDVFRAMLEQLRAMVGSMQAAASEVGAAAISIQKIASEHEDLTSQQSLRVAEVGETTLQLAGSAADITISAMEVLGDAERTVNTSTETLLRITTLSEQASGINEVLEVIREVADRSDLLALNGALEATRAGEAGRGFALVASEMRRLAERTAGSVSDVHARVEGINKTSVRTLTAMQDSRDLAARTAAAAQKISTVTEDQRRDTERVSKAMLLIANSVAATANATLQTLDAAEGLRRHAQVLESITRRWSEKGGTPAHQRAQLGSAQEADVRPDQQR